MHKDAQIKIMMTWLSLQGWLACTAAGEHVRALWLLVQGAGWLVGENVNYETYSNRKDNNEKDNHYHNDKLYFTIMTVEERLRA